MNTSLLRPVERRRLKAAFRGLVELCGGATEAARSCRVSASLLSRYGSEAEEHEGTFAPADVVKELELTAGEIPVTRLLADLQGFELVPRTRAQGSGDYAAHDSDLTRGSCAVLVGFRSAMADGSLCAADLVALERLSADLGRELAEFRHDAQRDIAATDRALGAAVTPLRGVR